MGLRTALEEALAADPDDRAAHAAYADLLTEQDDPRGELIAVQLALEDEMRPARERARLRAREAKLLRAHEREWLGELAPHLLDQEDIPAHLHDSWGYRFRWRRGWLDTVESGDLRLPFSRALARAPLARLLRVLIVRGQDLDWPEDDEAADLGGDYDYAPLLPLRGAPCVRNLRVFQLGEKPDDEGDWWRYRYRSEISGEAAFELVRGMPNLEELYLYADPVNTARLFALPTLTRLRVLHVYHLTEYRLTALAKNPAVAGLTHLLCHPHALRPREKPYLRLSHLRAVLRSPHLTGLTHLGLRMCDAGDKGCTEVVASGALKRLKVLDLRHGCVTDRGARILAACPDLRRLELLDLGNNCLTEEGDEALLATGVKVRLERQWDAEDEDEEGDYLFHGDIE
jgi:uncharacterized protein (TIGR02996 family)